MVISEYASVKSSKYYSDLGYDISEKYINVKIEHLTKGSRSVILARCHFCNSEREISYKKYNENVSRGGLFSCSPKCGIEKSKKSNLEKWGSEYVLKSEHFKKKSKKTLLEKWDVEHVSHIKEVSEKKSNKMKLISDEVSKRFIEYYSNLSEEEQKEINEKRKKTNISKWGVEIISQNIEIKEKVKNKVNEKYGGFTFQSEELTKKAHKTNLEKWGVENPSKCEEVKEKSKKTSLEKWGFEYPSQSDIVKNKVKDSLLKKFEEENIMFSVEFRSKFNISKNPNFIKYLGDRNYIFYCDVCESEYEIDYDNYYKRNLRGVNTCTNCNKISESSSIKENEFYDYIYSIYKGEIIKKYRDGLEIDVYLPEIGLGFEFNGLYWHSELKKEKNYHIDKTNYFKEKKIRIIHIWEDDWDNKKDIIKSQIKNWIGVNNNKIWARNCEISEISDPKEYSNFLEKNHIQGYIRSMYKIGLYHNNELVSLMTFDNSEGRNKMEEGAWNLSRFCNKIDLSVVGSASKLLNYFIKKKEPKRIISFADLDWSEGDLYYKLGFDLKYKLRPDYKWVIDGKRINKQRFTKNKIKNRGLNEDKSESENMNNLGYYKIFNTGQLKFEKVF
jgi:hypothetical protein